MVSLTAQQKELILDYCIGIISDDDNAEIESLIRENREAAQLCQKLRSAFLPLEALEAERCPDYLVERAVLRVKNTQAGEAQSNLEKLLTAEQRQGSNRGWFRNEIWGHLATAAVFIVVGGIIVTSFNVLTSYARHSNHRQQCAMQLSRIGSGIHQRRAENAGAMPSVALAGGQPWWKIGYQGKENHSNTRQLWRLVKKGYVKPGDFLCPGNPSGQVVTANVKNIQNLNDFPDRSNVTFSIRIKCPKSVRSQSAGRKILVADLSPLFERLPKDYNKPLKVLLDDNLLRLNSVNHNHKGQNILFDDGSVEFVKQRRIGPAQDDIFTLRDTTVYEGTELPSCQTDTFLAP